MTLSDVESAQLAQLGYPDPTEAYQRDAGLVVDGVVGPQTRCSIIADLGARQADGLEDFDGSLGLLVRLEGHRGVPYVPQDSPGSGVTLDPGFDLGQDHPHELLHALYDPIWGVSAVDELQSARGRRGRAARQWIDEWEPSLGRWSITRDQAAGILPSCAAPYWRELVRRESTHVMPPRVQTALLSFVYQLWVDDITPDMSRAIAMVDWASLADLVQDVPKDPRRRAIEAELIRRAA